MGYKLEQLLLWCQEDQLIHGFRYERGDTSVGITRHGVYQELPPDKALALLRRLIRSTGFGATHPDRQNEA